MKRVTARRKALAIASILGLVAIGGASAFGNPNGDMPMIISIREIMGSCVVAFLIGLVFGFYELVTPRISIRSMLCPESERLTIGLRILHTGSYEAGSEAWLKIRLAQT
jgi:hypothetical protein